MLAPLLLAGCVFVAPAPSIGDTGTDVRIRNQTDLRLTLSEVGQNSGHDLVTLDRQRPPSRPGDHRRRPRDVDPAGARSHSSNGVSIARRSGIRDCGSTSSTRNSASPPAVARV